MWRTHSCVPRRVSTRRLVWNWNLIRRNKCRDESLDTARTSARATVQRISEREYLAMLEAEDEFERARR
jgi:hypothetical protein